jgi:hypothetical protein
VDAWFRRFAQLVMSERFTKRLVLKPRRCSAEDIDYPDSGPIQNPIECLRYASNPPSNVVLTGMDKPELFRHT